MDHFKSKLLISVLFSLLAFPARADPDPKQPAALAKACDDAAGMPADAKVASPDVSLLGQADAHIDATHLDAIVEACTAAAAAEPREGRFQHRLGLAYVYLKRPADAVAAYRKAMEAGFAGGFDELSGAAFSGSLAPAQPKDGAAGIDIATKGIAATDNPEIKRDLATFLAQAPAPLGDQPRAKKLLEEAAAQNHGPAMTELAEALAEGGIGFPKDPARAKKLLDAAVAGGSRSATYELALLIDNGTGMPGDPKAARALYLKAAEMGDLQAMTSVSDMMRKGDGGPRDVEGGRKWLAREAAHGRLDAQRHTRQLLSARRPPQHGRRHHPDDARLAGRRRAVDLRARRDLQGRARRAARFGQGDWLVP